MTTNLVRGKARDAADRAARALTIGEPDARVFTCPACSRPLPNGTWRCTGCGVRLIMGVTLRRAGAVLVLGIAIGVLFGGATMVGAIALSRTQPAAVVVGQPAAAPIAPSAAPPAEYVAPAGVPPAALSALSGTAVVNGRIAVDAMTLSTTLVRRGATTIEIARALRSLAADAALGVDLTGRFRPWTDAAPVMTKLEDFYQAMAGTAHVGLRAPLSDDRSYRASAAEMMTVLGSLGDVDAASRTLASSVGLELPPVTLSSATDAGNPVGPTDP